jgi:uncharacterized protein (UPF0335 family)
MAERATAKRKRRANGNGGGPIGHNRKAVRSGVVPDEVYARWMKKIEEAQNAVEKAAAPLKSKKGALSAVYKAAKADGVDTDAIREAFKLDKLDHLDVATKFTNTGRVLRLMHSPLGEQMDLFRTSDLPIAVSAAIAGRRAGSLGHTKDNPHTPGTDAFVAYEDEYTRAQEQVAEQFR